MSLVCKGRISVELARDFLNYFIFSSSQDKLAQRLGIDSLSLKYDSQTKGIGIKKAVSEKLKASYEIEQPQVKEGQSSTTHKAGGEYKITESISVGAERELKQDKTEIQKKSETKDKVILKYKKEF